MAWYVACYLRFRDLEYRLLKNIEKTLYIEEKGIYVCKIFILFNILDFELCCWNWFENIQSHNEFGRFRSKWDKIF